MPTRHGTFLTALRFALLIAPLLLAACAYNDNGPSAMPTGYAYHNDIYKAPPGPEAEMGWWEKRKHALKAWRSNDEEPDPSVMVGDINAALPSQEEMMPQAMATPGWDGAAATLTGQIVAGAGGQIGTVRLVPSDGISPEMASAFEGGLRRALLYQGIGAEGGPYTLRYYARPTGSGTITGDTFLLVNLSRNGQTVIEKSGFFTVGGTPPLPGAAAIPADDPGIPMMLAP